MLLKYDEKKTKGEVLKTSSALHLGAASCYGFRCVSVSVFRAVHFERLYSYSAAWVQHHDTKSAFTYRITAELYTQI